MACFILYTCCHKVISCCARARLPELALSWLDSMGEAQTKVEGAKVRGMEHAAWTKARGMEY